MAAKAITEFNIYAYTYVSYYTCRNKLKCKFECVCYQSVFIVKISLYMSRIRDDKSYSRLQSHKGARKGGFCMSMLFLICAGQHGSVLSLGSLGKVNLYCL